jgi:outer membrane receptor protein involved in Fe transport
MPLKNLTVSLTYFDIAYKDKIQNPSTATVLTNESDFVGTGVVHRNPSPAEVMDLCTRPYVSTAVSCSATYGAVIDGRLRNLAVVDVEGVDLGVSHRFETSIGAFSSRLSGTYTLHYKEAITEASPLVDVVDTFARPLALRLRGSLGWNRLGWNLNAAASHQGSYRNPSNTLVPRIDSWTTVDVSGGYNFSGTSGWLSDLRVLWSVTNVADKEPPFVNDFRGYDTANGSLMGRTFGVQMVKAWRLGR